MRSLLSILVLLGLAARADAGINPPSSLTATTQGSSSIGLAWSVGLQGSGETIHVPAAQLVFRNQVQIATIAGSAATYIDAGLQPSTSYVYWIVGVADDGTHSTASNTANATTAAPCTGPCSLFAPNTGPDFEAGGDPMEVELGVRFSVDVAGTLSAIRFYKASTDDQPHTVTLWDGNGQVLATAQAAAAQGFGTQTVQLPQPIALAPGQVYTASYHERGGSYGFSQHYFASAIDNAPLHAPANAGVFRYGTSAFPSQSYNASNYWVDVVFSPAGGGSNLHPPSGLVAEVQSSTAIRLTWHPATEGSGETQHPAAAQVLYRDNQPLANLAGTAASYTDSVAAGSTHSYFVIGKDENGTASAPSNTATATTIAGCNGGPCSLFAPTAGPAFESVDPNQVELGVRFTSDVPGAITAIRFYKPSQDVQPHSVSLWSATGALLATVSVPAAQGFGMQTVQLPQPVAIAAHTIYTASYHASGGYFGYTPSFFTAPIDNGPLHAAATTNGVYRYGASAFPSQSFNANNYWADVVFVPQ